MKGDNVNIMDFKKSDKIKCIKTLIHSADQLEEGTVHEGREYIVEEVTLGLTPYIKVRGIERIYWSNDLFILINDHFDKDLFTL